MEKNNENSRALIKTILILLTVLFFLLGISIVMAISIALQKETITNKDKEIEELKTENAALKEENQDIMGLWSDLVIENK
jgi:cell division protein FtsB